MRFIPVISMILASATASAVEVGYDSLQKYEKSCTMHLRFIGSDKSCEAILRATKDDAAVAADPVASKGIKEAMECARAACGADAELGVILSVLGDECSGFGKIAKAIKGAMVPHGSNSVREKTLLITAGCGEGFAGRAWKSEPARIPAEKR